jgi:hypothetical protein
MTWQPIDTAPKDGKPLDLWVVYSWADGGTKEHGGSARRYADSIWHVASQRWLDFGGNPLDWSEIDEDGFAASKRPTHWMRVAAP